jgi:hypothetical protein
MAANLLVAALLNSVTFLIHAAGLIGLTHLMTLVTGGSPPVRGWSKLAAISVLTFGLFLLLCLEIGLWALGLMSVGVFSDFETAFYFSTSSFATIGFGDVAPAQQWRLLAAMEGVTGFLIIGWSSAYLVMAGIRYGPFERDTHF